jgi:hypothetical protein
MKTPPRPDRPPAPRRLRGLAWILGGVVWGVAVLGGTAVLQGYKSRPGVAATPPATWPEGSAVARAHDRATLVMLAHPECPCTRASVGELAELVTRAGARVAAHVLFLRPEEGAEDWEETEVWRSAAAIPGVTVHRDVGGVEAARFQASTSGQTVVYDSGGRLLFSGGITAGRGHAGDNAGRSRILALLAKGSAERGDSPVFGCSLRDPHPSPRP